MIPEEKWYQMDLIVKEGTKLLSTLCTIIATYKGKTIKSIAAKPNEINAKLLKLAGVKMPQIIPSKWINVFSRKKLVRQT
jgi:hypothetical protein